MPATVYSTISELLAYVQSNIAPNGTQAITGQKHQDVMLSVVQSLVNILGQVPPATSNDFPAWSGATTYTGGSEVVVKHSNKLWLFVSASDVVGTEPGTNGLVWQELSAVQLAHFRNKDQYLDLGGPNEVSALAIKRALSARSAWRAPVNAIAAGPWGGEELGYRYAIDWGAYDDFEGRDGSVAELTASGWVFYQVNEGDAMLLIGGSELLVRQASSWSYHNLALVGQVWTLSQILLAGDPFYGRMYLSAPLARIDFAISHNTAGTVSLNCAQYGAFRIILNANITMSWNSASAQQEFMVKLVGIGASSTVSWAADKWSALPGIALPSTVLAGEVYHMHFVEVEGRLCAVWAGKVTNV